MRGLKQIENHFISLGFRFYEPPGGGVDLIYFLTHYITPHTPYVNIFFILLFDKGQNRFNRLEHFEAFLLIFNPNNFKHRIIMSFLPMYYCTKQCVLKQKSRLRGFGISTNYSHDYSSFTIFLNFPEVFENVDLI